MNKEQFFAKVAGLDEAALRKALWTLYWRGSAQMRERVDAAIDPGVDVVQRQAAGQLPDPALVLARVSDFVALAWSGAYLGGSRDVSPKERTHWRSTFKYHATDAVAALGGKDIESASAALVLLIDLACDMSGYHYFRSDDPVEAARFVVSDAVAALWSAYRNDLGFPEFCQRAAEQLLRWESPYGWSRHGVGWVSERETPLAEVAAGMLPASDAWGQFADAYLRALDKGDEIPPKNRKRSPEVRASALKTWHGMLLGRLVDSEYEGRLDRLVKHPALAGPERTYLQARLAHHRGDLDKARRLIRECLAKRPGHPGFRAFAKEVGE